MVWYRIAEIETEMARTQKNKVSLCCVLGLCADSRQMSRREALYVQATEYHLGQLKAKLAKLRTELQAPPKARPSYGTYSACCCLLPPHQQLATDNIMISAGL